MKNTTIETESEKQRLSGIMRKKLRILRNRFHMFQAIENAKVS
jgi:hypothetical protein